MVTVWNVSGTSSLLHKPGHCGCFYERRGEGCPPQQVQVAPCLLDALPPSRPRVLLDGDVAVSVMVSCGDLFLLHNTLAAVLLGP